MNKNRKIIVLIVVVAIVGIVGFISYNNTKTKNAISETNIKHTDNETNTKDTNNENKAVVYEGYLIDEHCSSMKKGEKETIKCLKMEACESSGYGIAVENGDGTEKFIKFDECGHTMAKNLIDSATSEKLNKIIVKGHYKDDKYIVETIEGN